MPSHKSQQLSQQAGGNIQEGTRIAGYELKRLIGRGGMGRVYLARQVSIDRLVALKILSPNKVKKDPNAALSFIAEARSAGKLNHPHIIGVHDVGQTEFQGKTIHYFSMEYIEGHDLREEVKLRGPLKPKMIARVMGAMADALYYAHGKTMIHRDIKPENILITAEGMIKLADFGLAQQVNEDEDGHQSEDDDLASIRDKTPPNKTANKTPKKGQNRHRSSSGNNTTTGGKQAKRQKVMGTPAYLSPEQARGLNLDWRTDIYSLGATLFYLLTGTYPFKADNAKDMLACHIRSPVPDPRERLAHISDPWAELVMRMLAKDPADRAESPKHFRSLVVAAASAHSSTITCSPSSSLPAPKHTLTLALSTMALLILGGWWFTRQSPNLPDDHSSGQPHGQASSAQTAPETEQGTSNGAATDPVKDPLNNTSQAPHTLTPGQTSSTADHEGQDNTVNQPATTEDLTDGFQASEWITELERLQPNPAERLAAIRERGRDKTLSKANRQIIQQARKTIETDLVTQAIATSNLRTALRYWNRSSRPAKRATAQELQLALTNSWSTWHTRINNLSHQNIAGNNTNPATTLDQELAALKNKQWPKEMIAVASQHLEEHQQALQSWSAQAVKEHARLQVKDMVEDYRAKIDPTTATLISSAQPESILTFFSKNPELRKPYRVVERIARDTINLQQNMSQVCEEHVISTTLSRGSSSIQAKVLGIEGTHIVVAPSLGGSQYAGRIKQSLHSKSIDLSTILRDVARVGKWEDGDRMVQSFAWMWRLEWSKLNPRQLNRRHQSDGPPQLQVPLPIDIDVPAQALNPAPGNKQIVTVNLQSGDTNQQMLDLPDTSRGPLRLPLAKQLLITWQEIWDSKRINTDALPSIIFNRPIPPQHDVKIRLSDGTRLLVGLSRNPLELTSSNQAHILLDHQRIGTALSDGSQLILADQRHRPEHEDGMITLRMRWSGKACQFFIGTDEDQVMLRRFDGSPYYPLLGDGPAYIMIRQIPTSDASIGGPTDIHQIEIIPSP